MNPSLNTLRVGESALVSHIEAEPAMRRRLLELGLVPGTRVTCAAVSPAGDPAAYLIRGAVIALRRKDAGGVRLGEGQAWD
ncbi:FeoA family protein [uncultured Flavonifractor sp.]|uniref:FeoA family protein n=1 Tax=uncultured Flavonifractor sp. TaxID=1193534 RepID=UPI00174B8296|nr:FeoA family protein [uncultured Flavonifractor sp.]